MCVWCSVLTCADVVFVVCDGGEGIPQNRSRGDNHCILRIGSGNTCLKI